MPHDTETNRIDSLDLLRALAIFYIVAIRHLDDYAGDIYCSKIDDVITYSLLGLFVFLSGYLLSLRTPAIRSKHEILTFLARRFLRIYPLYILALLSFYLFCMLSARDVVIAALLLNMVTGTSVLTLWFVSMICLFYLMFPLVVQNYSLLKTAALCVGIVVLVTSVRKMFGLFDAVIPLYWPLFLLGVVSCKHALLDGYAYNGIVLVGSLPLFAVACFLYCCTGTYETLSLIALMTSSLPVCLTIGKSLSGILKKSIYRRIAYASFCMYLFHRVVFSVLTRVYSPKSNAYAVLYLSLVGVPIIVYGSYQIQKFYDLVTTQFLSRRLHRCAGL